MTKIALTGYMGSGKSTIGRELTTELNIRTKRAIESEFEDKRTETMVQVSDTKAQSRALGLLDIQQKKEIISQKISFIDADTEVQRLLSGHGIPTYIEKIGMKELEKQKVFIEGEELSNEDIKIRAQELGMKQFRKREAEAIHLASVNYKNNILALGGGALTDHDFYDYNVSTLKGGSYLTVYLDTPIDLILERMKSDAEGNEKRLDFDVDQHRKKYEERDDWYRRSSGLTVPNHGTIKETISLILNAPTFEGHFPEIK